MKIKEYNYWREEDRNNLEQIKHSRNLENETLSKLEKFLFVKWEIYRLQNGKYALIKTIPAVFLLLSLVTTFLVYCVMGVYEAFTEIKEDIKDNIIGKYKKAKKIK